MKTGWNVTLMILHPVRRYTILKLFLPQSSRRHYVVVEVLRHAVEDVHMILPRSRVSEKVVEAKRNRVHKTPNRPYKVGQKVNSEGDRNFDVGRDRMDHYSLRSDDDSMTENYLNDGSKVFCRLRDIPSMQGRDLDRSKIPTVIDKMPGETQNG